MSQADNAIEVHTEKEDPPYNKGPRPPPLLINNGARNVTVTRQWIVTKLQKDDISAAYPYKTQSIQADFGKLTFTCAITNCLYCGDVGPDNVDSFLGDVWIKSSDPVGVWVSRGRGVWDPWPGCDPENQLCYPFVPDRALWFNYVGGWTWVKRASLQPKMTEWEQNSVTRVWTTTMPDGTFRYPTMEDTVRIWKIPRDRKVLEFSAARKEVAEQKKNGVRLPVRRVYRVRHLKRPADEDEAGSSQPKKRQNGELSEQHEPLDDDPPSESHSGPASAGPSNAGRPPSTDHPMLPPIESSPHIHHGPNTSPFAHQVPPPQSSTSISEIVEALESPVPDFEMREASPIVSTLTAAASNSCNDAPPTIPNSQRVFNPTASTTRPDTDSITDGGSGARESQPSASATASVLSADPDRLWNIPVKQWPNNASSVTWKCGMKTVLPYAGRRVKGTNPDIRAVEMMAKKGLPGDTDPNTPFVFLSLGNSKFRQQAQDLKTYLARNHVIVMKGIRIESLGSKYDECGLEHIAGSLRVRLPYESANKRCEDEKRGFMRTPDRNVTMKEFLEMSGTSRHCGNLLEPRFHGEVPAIIGHLADDAWSFVNTYKVGYTAHRRPLQDDISERVAGISPMDREVHRLVADEIAKRMQDPETATELTNEEDIDTDFLWSKMAEWKAKRDVLREAGEGHGSDLKPDRKGPLFIPADVIRVRHWDAVTMAGFLEHPHHDANGLCTWATVQDGAKCWGIIRFRDEQLASCHSREDMMKLFDKVIHDGLKSLHTEEFDIFVIFLEEGDTIIMPPGCWHMVYTPVNCVMKGGHFLTLDALHLTQWSRAVDATRGRYATDHVYSGTRMMLARMTMALEFQSEPLKTRPFLALAAMVIHAHDYTVQDSEPSRDYEYEEDVDMIVAYRIIKAICIANDIKRDDTGAKSLISGTEWSDPGSEVINLDVLNRPGGIPTERGDW